MVWSPLLVSPIFSQSRNQIGGDVLLLGQSDVQQWSEVKRNGAGQRFQCVAGPTEPFRCLHLGRVPGHVLRPPCHEGRQPLDHDSSTTRRRRNYTSWICRQRRTFQQCRDYCHGPEINWKPSYCGHEHGARHNSPRRVRGSWRLSCLDELLP